jgi:serine/threonine-protein kinase
MKYGEAKKKLSDAGFEVRGLGIPTDGATVRKQTPDGGSQEPKGSTITLWVI